MVKLQSSIVEKQENSVKMSNKSSNKKKYFDESGEEISAEAAAKIKKAASKTTVTKEAIKNLDKRWYEIYNEYNSASQIFEDIKDSELNLLTKFCKQCFESESETQLNNNPNDSKWLETALHKGTAKDKANAGALLVQTNPISNLQALDNLINQTKISNKFGPEVVETVADLFINALIPSFRKLIAMPKRGADWKILKKNTEIEQLTKNKVYAYWYFEDKIKEYYFTFLQSLHNNLQNGKDVNKKKCILATSKLLTYGPERESYLLNLLVNKLGDPDKAIASKASYHLTQVVYKHPNMSAIVIAESEKLLFRNNISEGTQHLTLGFLSTISSLGNNDACMRLAKICFDFFKIKTEKGEVNTKTMRIILLCLKNALEKTISVGESNIDEMLSPEVLNTIYRLIHLSQIPVALQAMSLLLQLVVSRDGSHERFYNVMYKKLLDSELSNVNDKMISLFFHIYHQAIHIDKNIPRCQAFIKRLLQVGLNFPAPKACGILIIINKLLKTRSALMQDGQEVTANGEIVQTEVPENVKKSSFKNRNKGKMKKALESATAEDDETKANIHKNLGTYNPWYRNSEYAGAQFTLKFELVEYLNHYHPSVRSFAEQIVQYKKIDYYGDPIKDFCLTKFLDRFSFRNPKKMAKEQTAAVRELQGGRNKPIFSLTRENCTEEEKFIFNYLDKKRADSLVANSKKSKNEDEEDVSDVESIDDDEFNSYLDTLGATKDYEDGEDDVDFMTELTSDAIDKQNKDTKKQRKRDAENDDDDAINDWGSGDDSNDDEDDESDGSGDNDDDDNVSLEEDEMMNEGNDSDDDSIVSFSDEDDEDDDDEPRSKKSKKSRSVFDDKDFQKKLKESTGNSLFAGADEFAAMIEEAGKLRGHGTLGEVFNKDKASDKQIAWEGARNKKAYGKFGAKKNFGGNSKKKNFSKPKSPKMGKKNKVSKKKK